jgi:spore coat protein U-like protein
MRRILTALAALTACAIVSHHVLNAQSASASLTVSANVQKNCTISTTPVNFGGYDPVAANSTNPLDGIGTVVVACTKGATAHVGLNDGANSQGSTRRMRQSAAAYLEYQIYKDASRSDVWGDSFDSNLDTGPAPNRNPRTFTAYGRVPAGQDATVGNYVDTVVATVNF